MKSYFEYTIKEMPFMALQLEQIKIKIKKNKIILSLGESMGKQVLGNEAVLDSF